MARPLSAEARTKALDAAHELLLERGLDGCTVEAVAKRSGVAKTTIYRHWSSAHELLTAALRGLIDTFPTPNTGSLREDLLAYFRHGLPLFTAPGMRSVVLGLMRAAEGDADLRAIHEQLIEHREDPILIIIELAVARGELPPDTDIELAGDFVEGPVFRHVLVRDAVLTDAQLVRLVDWAVAGLRAGTAVGAGAGASSA
ncbi:MAG: TetR/AcrR family transcriptional regulator [Acidimicrobiales bacterium]|nr:TetR/AcrR family transcriptional regulator [Acidimicrobiales bacterium]